MGSERNSEASALTEPVQNEVGSLPQTAKADSMLNAEARLRNGFLYSERLGSFLAKGWPIENGVVCTPQEVRVAKYKLEIVRL
jgi:hypothetical protein